MNGNQKMILVCDWSIMIATEYHRIQQRKEKWNSSHVRYVDGNDYDEKFFCFFGRIVRDVYS